MASSDLTADDRGIATVVAIPPQEVNLSRYRGADDFWNRLAEGSRL